MNKRVLLVGKFESHQSIVSVLECAGFMITKEPDWSGGLKYIYDQSPDIVIIDEGESPEHGIQLLSRLGCPASAPIIVLGSGGGEAIVDSLIQGAAAYIPWTTSWELILSYVRNLSYRKSMPAMVFEGLGSE